MVGFTSFLTEGKNTHLTHAADLVFEGYVRTNMAVDFIESVVGMLEGHSKSKLNVTRKWDGAPALFVGINPENDKFFVGTKSVFNKGTAKINYTNADITRNHGGGLADKLKVALKELKSVVVGGIYQGDMLFTKSDLEKKDIDGESFVTFTPNTITYAIPSDSDMAKKISKSSMGIAFHTKYTGKDMESMKASFNVTKKSFKTNSKVLVEDATYFDQSGRASFTAAEMKSVTKEVAKARQLTDANKRGLDWLAGENKIVALLNIYANSTVKAGDLTLRYTDFVAMIKERYEEDAAKLKREANQKNKIAQGKQLISTIQRNKKSMDGIFKLHSVLNKATLLLINKLEGIKSYKTFLKRADGFEVTGEEGFVASDHLGNVIKLVDRLQFSRANMTIAKNWIKG
tara:strand:+ start:1013 stop:2215 length:1203 start_codon:yes stop_codon:yes gene_type:complete